MRETLIKSMQIGPHNYIITFVTDLCTPDGKGLYAQAVTSSCEIHVDSELQPQQLPSILLHEAMHVILDYACFESAIEKTEKVIKVLSLGLVKLFQDNPKLRNVFFEE